MTPIWGHIVSLPNLAGHPFTLPDASADPLLQFWEWVEIAPEDPQLIVAFGHHPEHGTADPCEALLRRKAEIGEFGLRRRGSRYKAVHDRDQERLLGREVLVECSGAAGMCDPHDRRTRFNRRATMVLPRRGNEKGPRPVL